MEQSYINAKWTQPELLLHMGRIRIVFKDMILVTRNLFCHHDGRKTVDDFRNLSIIIERPLNADIP